MSDELSQLLDDTTLDDASSSELLAPPLARGTTKAPPPPKATALPPPLKSKSISHVTEFPLELQVNILTYLRAYDLATVHRTCRFFRDPQLVHAIVVHAAERVYPLELTRGFDQQPVLSSRTTSEGDPTPASNKQGATNKGPVRTAAASTNTASSTLYTFEHLRNMELLVVARVLSRPEPPLDDRDNNNGRAGGYYVSKSWCKTALKWLEWQQERQQQYAAQQQAAAAAQSHHHKKNNHNKKLSKKQQRLRQRKYSDAMQAPPGPNVNSDIVCCHDQLQLCRNRKSARARRKLLDKQAWKCLKKLYPESVSLDATQGECVQCLLETETSKHEAQQREAQLKEERKAPLSHTVVRRFYTRTRGVPVHCLVADDNADTAGTNNEDTSEKEDQKPPAVMASSCSTPPTKKKSVGGGNCPLVPGLYYAVPRAWCHAWRKYMKTGEGGPLLPPDASSLLCGFHRLPLFPPHLESYLYGESPQLWLSKKQQQQQQQQQQQDNDDSTMEVSSSSLLAGGGGGVASPAVARRSVVGMSPPAAGMFVSPAELGLSPAEVAQQQRAMMTLERQREQQQQREREAQQQQQQPLLLDERRWSSMGEQLDRENYCCVEILAHEELKALEQLWPRGGTSSFRFSFEVLPGQEVQFSTPPCRECDASGMANFCKIPKNSKAHLRAAHQARVRNYKEHKTGSGSSNNNNASSASSKPGVQLEY